MEFLQLTTTTATRPDAERIAAQLVAQKLAGCVQITGPIASTYRWQGKIETSEEWMCTIKTARQQLPAIERLIDEIHPYEVPELIASPVVAGSDKYLAWLREQLES